MYIYGASKHKGSEFVNCDTKTQIQVTARLHLSLPHVSVYQVCSFINWTMRSFSEIEMWFNAVERVTHYAKTPSEPYHTVTGT